VVEDLRGFGTVVMWMHTIAPNTLIWGKLLVNLETRAKTGDQPGKAYKIVD
jgi:hypothetical protein